MKRNSVICKIIEEVSQFLMKKGYYDIDISIRQTEHKSVLSFTTNKINDKLLKVIKERLCVERREEIEEYYWELMGEGIASKQDLALVGVVTDEAIFEESNDKTIVRLIRNE